MDLPISSKASNWSHIGSELAIALAQMQEQPFSGADRTIAEDMEKLKTIGAKLNTITHPTLQITGENSGVSDDRNLRHEIRNLIGTAIGYCEFIQERLDPRGNEQLDLHLKQVLAISQSFHSDVQPHMPSNTVAENRSTILIVDDQVESRELLSRHLRRGDYQLLEAADGREMLEQLKTHKVDLILLDLILPEMDGDELLQQLKKDEVLRAIPVIVVSGSEDEQRIIRCIESGAEDYLFKPFNPVLLQARIGAGIERKNWHDTEQQYLAELERNQRFIRSVFGRYLSTQIVDTLLENPDGLDLGGSQRKVTVLMADISGFSTIAEQLAPDRVVRLLNNYLGTMSEIVMQYGGTVDEFIGDAILAIFGAPIHSDNDADKALCAAIAMQAAMVEINKRNRADDLPEIDMGISVNTGWVVAGNIGSEKRAKYGVVGHAVNETSRLCNFCSAGEILVSEATLNDTELFIAVDAESSFHAKGITQPITAYSISGVSPHSVNRLNGKLNSAN